MNSCTDCDLVKYCSDKCKEEHLELLSKIVTKGKAELLREKECRMHAEMSIDPLKSSNYSCCVMKRVNANDPTGCKTLQ